MLKNTQTMLKNHYLINKRKRKGFTGNEKTKKYYKIYIINCNNNVSNYN